MKYFTLLSVAALLLACGASPESTGLDPDTTTTETDDLPVEQDQIEFTRNVDPSTLDDAQLDTTKTVIKQNMQSAPDKQSNPAPLPPDPAPAAAPDTPQSAAGLYTVEKASEPGQPTATETPAVQTSVTDVRPAPEPDGQQAPDHGSWNDLLRRHVSNVGNVDYAAMQRDEAKLDEYLSSLKTNPPTNDWPRNERLAYWINAYNAFTVKRILSDYPLNSITDLDGGDPWKVKWIDIGDQTYSLNNIEHDIIRPRFNEPRIHFAVNCAAASCPPLPNRAFTAGNLNRMLETSTRAFIRNPDYNQTSGEVKVSKIFDWYGEDFGDLRSYLNKYLATSIPAGTDIAFKEYDWSLNKQ